MHSSEQLVPQVTDLRSLYIEVSHNISDHNTAAPEENDLRLKARQRLIKNLGVLAARGEEPDRPSHLDYQLFGFIFKALRLRETAKDSSSWTSLPELRLASDCIVDDKIAATSLELISHGLPASNNDSYTVICVEQIHMEEGSFSSPITDPWDKSDATPPPTRLDASYKIAV